MSRCNTALHGRGQRRSVRGVLVLLLASSSRVAAAHAQQAPALDVQVVDVAAGRAYLTPGQDAGIHAGDTVTIGKHDYRVLGSSAHSAVLDLGDQRDQRDQQVAPGTHGTAHVAATARTETKTLAAPRALPAFQQQWPRATLPASQQTPQAVPLGPAGSDSATWVQLSLRGTGNVPLRGKQDPFAATELRARAHFEPLHELPLRLDADVATQLWLGSNIAQRAGDASRPLLRVRELQAAYGQDAGSFAALGRMRYASRSLGMLDGGHVQAALGAGLTLGAFGGIVPDPLDGTPSSDASRFGAELGYRDLQARLRPEVSVVAQGSRYAGGLDERRLSSFVDLYPGEHRVGGYAELSFFDANNPWRAPAQELSAAGIDGTLHLGKVDLSGRVDMQRPERSRWLAAYLPPEWLCTHRAAIPSASPEPCHDNDARYLASGNAGWASGKLALNLGASASSTQNANADQLASFLRASVLNVVARARVEGSVSGSAGSLLQSLGGSVGVGSPFWRDTADLSVHYRPTWLRYAADPNGFVQHALGASLLFMPSSVFELSFNADLLAGPDVSVFLAQTLLTVRPGRN